MQHLRPFIQILERHFIPRTGGILGAMRLFVACVLDGHQQSNQSMPSALHEPLFWHDGGRPLCTSVMG